MKITEITANNGNKKLITKNVFLRVFIGTKQNCDQLSDL